MKQIFYKGLKRKKLKRILRLSVIVVLCWFFLPVSWNSFEMTIPYLEMDRRIFLHGFGLEVNMR